MKSIFLIGLSFSFVTSILLGSAAMFRARQRKRFYSFSIFCLAGAGYALVYSLEIILPFSKDSYNILFIFQYIFTMLEVVFFLFTIRAFAGKERASLSMYFVVSLIPFLSVLFFAIPSLRFLMYQNMELIEYNGLHFPTYNVGIWNIFNGAYTFFVFVYGIITVIRIMKSGIFEQKRQALPMFIGLSFQIVVVSYTALQPKHVFIDYGPIFFFVTMLFLASGFFKHRMFDIRPIGRDVVFNQIRDAVLVLNEVGTIADYNKAAVELFPILSTNTPNQNIKSIFSDYIQKDEKQIDVNLIGGNAVVIKHKEHQERNYEVHRSTLIDSKNNILGETFLFIDITEHEQLTEQLTKLAETDELTSLPNRRALYQFISKIFEKAKSHNESISFAIMDLNDFKLINDVYGHRTGDQALKLAAKICKKIIQKDAFVSRIGGDEFAFAFHGLDENEVQAQINNISSAISSESLIVGNSHITLSASIGVVTSYPPNYLSIEQLFSIADKKMYQEKSIYTNRKKSN